MTDMHEALEIDPTLDRRSAAGLGRMAQGPFRAMGPATTSGAV